MNKEILSKLNGIWVIMLGYLSWCFMTISYKNSVYLLLVVFCTGASLGLFAITVRKYASELQIPIGVAVVFLLIGFGQLLHIGSFADATLVMICGAWGLTLTVMYMRNNSAKTDMQSKISAFFCEYKWLVCLLVLQLILAYDSNLYQFKWDGLLYYRTCQNLSLTSISSLAIYGHIAQTYGVIVAAASLFIQDVGIAMIAMNMLLLTISTVFFYRLVKLIVPDKKEILYIIATAIFAFSPFYLGMVGYHNLDFYLQCLFPVVLYYTLAKKWAQQFVTACLFCFTKEPAIIIYAGLCLGTLLVDWFSNQEKEFWKRCKRIIGTVHYYYMMLPDVLWFVTYKFLGPWSAGDSSSGFDIAYIWNKLKVLYCFQFNWLFSLILMLGIVLLGIKKRMGILLWWLVPVLMAQSFFTVFSCFLQTVNHPRYSDSTMLVLYLLSAVIVLEFCSSKIFKITCSVLAILLLISNYRTIDPISKFVFTVTNIGKTDLVTTTKSIPFGDGAIYNKQSLWVENVMNRAIEDSLEEDTLIVVPAINNGTYSFDGVSEVTGVTDGYYQQKQYWNDKRAKRVVLPSDSMLQYNLYFVSNMDSILTNLPRKQGQNISFFYYEDAGEEYLDSFLNNCSLIGIEDYDYRGWILHRAILKVD